ncbi:ATP phosphoribosyltransferase catalytic subunit HisG, partial [Mesorhizobium sp. M7A.F.Ca.CA.004.06.1.1]
HLKVLGDGLVLRSQACLVASKKTRAAADEAVLRDIAAKMAAAVG